MNVRMVLGQSFPQKVPGTPDPQYSDRNYVTKGFCGQIGLGKAEVLKYIYRSRKYPSMHV